jgi:excisionase family DNA binding protein
VTSLKEDDKKFKKDILTALKQCNTNDYLMTVDEVATRLRTSAIVVRKLVEKGELDRLLLCGVKISNSEVNKFIEKNKGRDFSKILS